jgi:hypothetical protein
MQAYTLRLPHHMLIVSTEKADPSLFTQGWVGDKPCLVTVDKGAYVTVARPDITAGWPKRQPNQCYTLQMVYGEALPILKEFFLTLTLVRHAMKIKVFVANITNKFILRQGILRTYDASVDLGLQMQCPAEKRYRYGAPGQGHGLPAR